MLHETVLITWCTEKVEAEQCEPTLVCNIEKMGDDLWTIRMKDDTTKQIHVGQTESIERVDEDDHHDFVNEFLMVRKHNDVMQLASDVLAKFDEIASYCPEDRDTLFEQLEIDIKALRQAEKDSQ